MRMEMPDRGWDVPTDFGASDMPIFDPPILLTIPNNGYQFRACSALPQSPE